MDVRLIVLALGAFAGTMESAVLPGLLPAIGTEMGVTVAQAGLLVFAYSVAYSLSAPIISSLFSSVDRRTTLVVAELVFGLSALAMALLHVFDLIVVARGVLAVAAVLFTSTAQATAYAISPPDRRGRAVGFVVTGATLAVALGAPAGAVLGLNYGWRLTFGIIAALAVASGLVMALRLPKGLANERHSFAERLAVLKQPGVGLALMISLITALGVFPPGIYFASLTTDVMHMDIAGIPVVMLSAGIGAVAGSTLGGQMTDRMGVFPAVILLSIAVTVLLAAMSAVTLLPASLVPPFWVVLYGLLSFAGWGLYSAQVGLLGGLAPQAVTLAISLNLTSSNFGGAIAAVIGGQVIERLGGGSLGLVCAGFCAVSLALLFLNRRTFARVGRSER